VILGERKQPVEMSRYMNVEMAAAYLGTTRAALYHRIARRAIPFTRVGHRILIDRRTLDRWLRRNAIEVTE
jgi:excisionase family DNA binding protein